MKISYNWIKEYIDIDKTPVETAEILTDIGLEVEGIEPFESIKGGLNGVVVGKVLQCSQHPNADRLKLTTVDIGEKEYLQIVCGAQNVKENLKVAVATIGTALYDKDGNPWKIKKGKIRGELSLGMLCAEDELGLGNSHDGILELEENAPIGAPLNQIFEVENDTIFEIGLTPNRADAMSHFGVARDLSASQYLNENLAKVVTSSLSSFHIDNRSLKIDIKVEDLQKAPRYCGITITEIKVKPSPLWLQNRLRSIGLTPLNNVVDITNYLLHDIGQPLHAFDATQIKDKKIIVKTVESGTKFTTLDGVERTLHEDDLMICDAEKPLCIAGIYGGLNSGVSENTHSVFLESAYFDPINTRRSAKRHGLSTDASYRFERGIDPALCKYALKRAAIMICQIAGGNISSDTEEIYPNKIEDFTVSVSFENIDKIVGQKIPHEAIKDILSSLDMKIVSITEAGLGLSIPAYRNDVTREIDVIEEILRIYGYNNIEVPQKMNIAIISKSAIENHTIENKMGQLLTAHGFFETISNPLTNVEYLKLNPEIEEQNTIKIINPLSNDLAILKTSPLYSGLETLSFNKNRQNPNLKTFEFVTTYQYKGVDTDEQKYVSILAMGNKQNEANWQQKNASVSFYYIKGILETLLLSLGLDEATYKPFSPSQWESGLEVYHSNTKLGVFGSVESSILDYFDLSEPVFYVELQWEAILQYIHTENVPIKPIPKFPEVKRDIAILIDDNVNYQDLEKTIISSNNKLLKSMNLFDVYKGDELPEGKKSYGLSFKIQDVQQTLTDKKVDKLMKKIVTLLQDKFEVTLR